MVRACLDTKFKGLSGTVFAVAAPCYGTVAMAVGTDRLNVGS